MCLSSLCLIGRSVHASHQLFHQQEQRELCLRHEHRQQTVSARGEAQSPVKTDNNRGLRLSARKLSTLNKHLESISCDTDKMWNDIEDVIIKTLISAHPILKHNYHTCFPSHTSGSACFEILGFDVLLDHRLRPWLLEVTEMKLFSFQ